MPFDIRSLWRWMLLISIHGSHRVDFGLFGALRFGNADYFENSGNICHYSRNNQARRLAWAGWAWAGLVGLVWLGLGDIEVRADS
ncbi:Uncharacterised protein [Arcanobacterium haemolyticum]|uniref:hypothetical protein n=1 Tax=Arcanobacterium haemolyticum TaxID=28264 RepID=UPI000D8F6B9A|nr:hypothetical protein [Arcanobacterium haemolyticum]SPT74777.1 Uncharacterised protein [Arcanobacterium haemolyticum]